MECRRLDVGGSGGLGDPLRAIRLEMRRIAAISAELPGRLLSAILGEAQNDPVIRKALLERLIYPRREATARAVREAQDSCPRRRRPRRRDRRWWDRGHAPAAAP